MHLRSLPWQAFWEQPALKPNLCPDQGNMDLTETFPAQETTLTMIWTAATVSCDKLWARPVLLLMHVHVHSCTVAILFVRARSSGSPSQLPAVHGIRYTWCCDLNFYANGCLACQVFSVLNIYENVYATLIAKLLNVEYYAQTRC